MYSAHRAQLQYNISSTGTGTVNSFWQVFVKCTGNNINSAVLRIRGIFARIQILGSVPNNYGSGSGFRSGSNLEKSSYNKDLF
jgi:hypothetical protein